MSGEQVLWGVIHSGDRSVWMWDKECAHPASQLLWGLDHSFCQHCQQYVRDVEPVTKRFRGRRIKRKNNVQAFNRATTANSGVPAKKQESKPTKPKAAVTEQLGLF